MQDVPAQVIQAEDYIGGIGVAINKSTTTLDFIGSPIFDTFETIDTRFAWNIGAGVAVPITEILLLELSCRYTF